MMSFERFKEKVVNEFLDYFPDAYANATVITKEVTKNNEVLTGLCLKSNATVSVTPVVYLEPAYREMQTTGISADKIIEDLADISASGQDLRLAHFHIVIIFRFLECHLYILL